MNTLNADDFWAYCAQVGVRSKRLSIRRQASADAPLALVSSEKICYGSPVVSVPYNAVLNCQTLRGNLVPPALPPFDKAKRFLLRRGRMSVTAVSRLWLAGYLACARRQVELYEHFHTSTGCDSARLSYLCTKAQHKKINAALVASFMPHLSLLAPRETATTRALTNPVATRLPRDEMDQMLHAFYCLMSFYAKRVRVAKALRPSISDLTDAHATVLQRGLPLPIHCTPSAPDDLAELIDSNPHLVQLHSLVPVIDLACIANHTRLSSHVQAPSPLPVASSSTISSKEKTNHCIDHENHNDRSEESEMSYGNTDIYTCVEAQFENDNSRRRVIVETSPLSARRVVLCASRDINENEPVTLLCR